MSVTKEKITTKVEQKKRRDNKESRKKRYKKWINNENRQH